jgi:hypothetical protein
MFLCKQLNYHNVSKFGIIKKKTPTKLYNVVIYINQRELNFYSNESAYEIKQKQMHWIEQPI